MAVSALATYKPKAKVKKNVTDVEKFFYDNLGETESKVLFLVVMIISGVTVILIIIAIILLCALKKKKKKDEAIKTLGTGNVDFVVEDMVKKNTMTPGEVDQKVDYAELHNQNSIKELSKTNSPTKGGLVGDNLSNRPVTREDDEYIPFQKPAT